VSAPVVVLAGGTGGAQLARGMLDVVAPEDLVVIANTGDDIEIYGAYVAPDPDLITFWLADRIDARGWGIDGDTFHVMDGLRELGQEVWFNLGDRDLAIGIRRAQALARGASLTAAQQELVTALGVRARVLPMSDTPVRTRVLADRRWCSLQEFMIRGRGQGPVDDVQFRGAAGASAPTAVIDAISSARAIVIGPSNPVISIGPILAVREIADALRDTECPVVAVSPLVGGAVVKGPTEPFMAWAGQPLSSTGIAALYEGLIDGLVADERTDAVTVLLTDVLMGDPAARRRLATDTLRFAEGLG